MTTRDDSVGGLWCPRCGVEYRPGFTTCADCFVPLVDIQPEPTSSEVHDEPVVYDLTEWPETKRSKLALLMRSAGIPIVWLEGDVLSVPAASERDMDNLIDDLDSEPEPDDAPTEATPGRPSFDTSMWVPALVHRCGHIACPFGLELTIDQATEMAVSWTVRSDDDVSFVTLGDVIAAHPDQVTSVVAEHAATLTDAARQAEAMTTARRQHEPNDDLAATVTLENLADFAAELASWCLVRDAGSDDGSVWVGATAVMRAVVAMSALTDLVDAAGDQVD